MPKTNTPPETINNTHAADNPTRFSSLEDARNIATQITESDVFYTLAAQGGVDIRTTSSDEYLELMSVTTRDYVENNQNNNLLSYEQAAAILVFGQAPYALRQQELLEANSQQRFLGSKEFHDAKDYLVNYNADVSALLRAYPDEPLENIEANIVRTATEKMESSPESLQRYVNDTLRGMRAENTFYDMVEPLGIPIRHGTPQEERKGVDFVVGSGAQSIRVDIKDSLDQVAGKNGGYADKMPYAKTRDGNIVYFPYTKDIIYKNGSSTVKNEMVEPVRMQILGDLGRMLHA